MDAPKIADNKSCEVELEKGKTYFFCTCGLSEKQPFCDGSHSGSSFSPLKFEAEKDGKAWLCACKQTKKAPYCDGSHKTLDDK